METTSNDSKALTGITYNKPVSWRRLNSQGASIKYFNLKSEGVAERTSELLKIYGNDYNLWNKISNQYGIKTEVAVCIAWSETGIGKATKSGYNVGNVGNNDRGDVVHYTSLSQGVTSMVYTIAKGTYMKNKVFIGDLYPKHIEKPCKNDCKYVYASSPENAMNNVLNCLGMIYNQEIKSDFSYRK